MLSVESVCTFGWWNQKVDIITDFELQRFWFACIIHIVYSALITKSGPICYGLWFVTNSKEFDTFDHTRPWLVLFLDLLNSWVRTLLKTGICLHGCHNEWCKILACILRFGPLFSLAVGSRMIRWTSDQFGDRRRLQGISQKCARNWMSLLELILCGVICRP